MKLIFEGGGQNDALKTEARRAFTTLLEKAQVTRKPRTVAAGGRDAAYKSFTSAIGKGEAAVLLVDSEQPVTTTDPWAHVEARDKWPRPEGVSNDHLHLMVESMENWFLADVDALKTFFGMGFRESALPGNPQIERVAKVAALKALENASADAKSKGRYEKGRHSFKLLAALTPSKLEYASPWAKRFFEHLRK